MSDPGERLIRLVVANNSQDAGLVDGQMPAPMTLGRAALQLNDALNRCEKLGVFSADQTENLKEDTLSFTLKQILQFARDINIIAALFEGWDIHLKHAQELIQRLSRADEQLSQNIIEKVVNDIIHVDMELQAMFLTGELTTEEYDRIKEMPVAMDRVEALSTKK